MVRIVPSLVLVLSLLVPAGFAWPDFYVISAGKRAKRTILVSPAGTAKDSGAALLKAVSGITDNSSTNPWLIKIEPGIYDIGSSSLQMKPYVDIEGSGQEVTWIMGTVDSATAGVILGSSDAEIRHLSVANDGGGSFATGICNPGTSPRISHVTVRARNADTNYAIQNLSGSQAVLKNVTAWAIGIAGSSGLAVGIWNVASSPTLAQVLAKASNAGWNHAVFNDQGSSTTMTDVETHAAGGSDYNVGVYNYKSSPDLFNVSASAMGGGTSQSIGILNVSSSPTIMGARISVSSTGGGTHYGIRNDDGSGVILIRSSLIESVGYGIYCGPITNAITVRLVHSHVQGSYKALGNGNYSTLLVGDCLLDGGVLISGGTVTCYGDFDQNMNPISCP